MDKSAAGSQSTSSHGAVSTTRGKGLVQPTFHPAVVPLQPGSTRLSFVHEHTQKLREARISESYCPPLKSPDIHVGSALWRVSNSDLGFS